MDVWFTRVTSPNGRKLIAFVPRRPEEMARGLGGRDYMSPETGMLFDFGSIGDRVMTTEPMRFALDVVWMSDGKIVMRVDRGVRPGRKLGGRGRFVLELVAGAADVYGISVGAKMSWERPTK